MKILEVKHGFHAFLFGKDCFIETKQVKKSRGLALEFINAIQNRRNTFYNIMEGDIDYMLYCMEKATLEFREGKRGRDINIYGESWGGCGTDILPFDVNPYDKIIYCVDNRK